MDVVAHPDAATPAPGDAGPADVTVDVGGDVGGDVDVTDAVAGGALEPVLHAAGFAGWELDHDGRVRWSPMLPALLDLAEAEQAEVEAALLTLIAPIRTSIGTSPWEDYVLDHDHTLSDGTTRRLRIYGRVTWRSPAAGRWETQPRAIGLICHPDAVKSGEVVESEDRYRILVELSPDAHVVHQGGRVVFATPVALAMVDRPHDEVIGRPITDFVAPDSRAEMFARISSLVTTGMASESTEAELLRKDGSTVVIQSVAVLSRWHGEPAYQVIMRDLRKEKAAAAALQLSEERYTTAVAALDEGVVMLDAEGRVETCNPAAAKILGIVPASLIGKPILAAVAFVDEEGDRLAPAFHPVEQARVAGQAPDRRTIGAIRSDGAEIWLSVSARVVGSTDAAEGGSVVLSFSDVTDRRANARRLQHEARHDDLTGLANRKYVLERLAAILDLELHPDTAAFFVDVDRFKTVNDSLGHEAGNRLLIEIGRRLQESAHRAAVIGRISGDEFIFVANEIADADEARGLADHLLEAISRPMEIEGRSVAVSASVGVALLNRSRYRNGEEILRDADVAMYRAKLQGRARVVIFDQDLRRAVVDELELREDLREAIRAGEIWPAFQPLVSLADGRVVGTEALARWDHATRGAVGPAEFIPLAEDTGLIVPLGEHVLTEASACTARWHATDGLRGLGLSVNLSTRQFAAPSLPDTIAGVLEESGLRPADLTLEITESVLIDNPEAAAGTLGAIKRLGVRLSLDDFGTGYSSLSYLRRFPVDNVKIDRSFLAEIRDNAADRAIVANVIQLAHVLDLTVTAEGVETREQHDLLGDLGCDTVQGFYHGRPVSAADLPGEILRIESS